MASHREPPLTYLDHAASTPLRPEVAEAMAPYGADRYGHPSAGHRMGRQARTALEEARDTVARVLGARPAEVVFTSGGTEADNLAVFGAALAAAGGGRQGALVCSAVEHAAVAEPCRVAARRITGIEHRSAGVHADGTVDLDRLADALDEEVLLVSVMLANNEVGTVQPLADVVDLVRRLAPRALVHTDAVQAAPWLDVGALGAGCDLVSVSAHKLGGPKGAGALVVRHGAAIEPLVVGGGQEQGRRGGTHDVAGAVGLATALASSAAGRDAEAVRVRGLRDRLADGLLAGVPGIVETVDRKGVLPGHCHLCVDGVDREELLVLLDRAGVCVSAGAACASGAVESSPTLAAMGVEPELARGAVRFSLGHTTTAADVERALAVVPEAVGRLRG
jgi:cysteine desulfurase